MSNFTSVPQKNANDVLYSLVTRWKNRPLTLYTQILQETEHLCTLRELSSLLKEYPRQLQHTSVSIVSSTGLSLLLTYTQDNMYMFEKLKEFTNESIKYQVYLMRRFF